MKRTPSLKELLGEEPAHLEAAWGALAPHLGLGPAPRRLRGPLVLGVREGFPYPYRLVFGRGGGLARLQVLLRGRSLRLGPSSPPEALEGLSLGEGIRVLAEYAPALEALGLSGPWRRQALLVLLRAKPQGEVYRLGGEYHLLKAQGHGWVHATAYPEGPGVRVELLPLEGLFPLLEGPLAQGGFPATPRPIPLVDLLREGLGKGWGEEELLEGLLALRAWSEALLEAYRGLLGRVPKEALPGVLPDGRLTLRHLGEGKPAQEAPDPALAFRETWDSFLLDLFPLPFDPLDHAPRPIPHGGGLYFYGPGWWGLEEP